MKGKNFDSNYLITRLFSTDYFHCYSTPAFFSAYFFPFVAYGKNREYLESEFTEKIKNIKENKHGNFYNYATQGFGNVAFWAPSISFSYFYKKICSYEKDAEQYFMKQIEVGGLESANMTKDIKFVLNKDNLLLKRGMKVSEQIKTELISDLTNHGNKYVLAKLLFYITSESHCLPNVVIEQGDLIYKKLQLSEKTKNPNIYLDFRKSIDFDANELDSILLRATNVRILCINGSTLFDNQNPTAKLLEVFKVNSKLKMEVIISKKDSEFYLDASEYQMNYDHLSMPKVEYGNKILECFNEVKEALPNESIAIKTTDKNIPYSLLIVQFEEKELDYIKVDLYSPFILNNCERPSMCVFKTVTPELFEHFKRVFEQAWKNDRYSQFY